VEQIGTFATSGYTLRDLQLFHDADRRLEAQLAGCAVVRLAAGEAIGDAARARLFIVLRGQLEVALPDGSTSAIQPGESAGEQAVLDDSGELAAMSASVATELLVIDGELVWRLIDQSNSLARNLLRLLSFRVRAANAMLRRRHKLGEFYRQLSMNDGLTGLYNRAWLGDMLPKLVATAHRTGEPLSLILLDLDHFKKFNDTHGHVAGDDALRAAAAVIGADLRPSDYAVRYGGEELMVLLPDTSPALAVLVAERLCTRMRGAIVFPDMRINLPHLTASFGVAVLGEGMHERALIDAADAALYRAKQAGRDRVST
jgi:diguanylate cyclase (GGDEF)-like protein